MLGGAREPWGRREQRFFLRCAHDRRLLPTRLYFAVAAAPQHDVLRNAGGGRSRRAATLQTLPADGRLGRFAACRRDREGVRAAAEERHNADTRRARRRGGGPPGSIFTGV